MSGNILVGNSKMKQKLPSLAQLTVPDRTFYWQLNGKEAITTLVVVPLAGAFGSVGATAVTDPGLSGLRLLQS